MNSWYKHTNQKKSKSGRRVYETWLPPKLDRTIDDIYIISKRGDRLDLLADKYYGDPDKWRIIAAANQLGKGTLVITPGLQIRIPSNPDSVFEQLLNQNRNR